MSAPTTSSTSDRRQSAGVARAALGAILISYVVFLFFYVPRLNNFVLSDREFTGWVGPIAERVARGERPYLDFVLPIPPGSFVILAAIQRLAGGALLIQELWVAAASHLLMGLMAYGIAVRFSTGRVALLVAVTTLVLVTQAPKECVYDHTSLLLAWLSILLGARALLARGPSRDRLWFWTGLSATTSVCFKQSTAVGIVAGWVLALAYLVAVELRAKRRGEASSRVADAVHWAGGAAAGLFVVLGLLLALRAPPLEFVRAIFIDGPALKGGFRALFRDLLRFVAGNDAVRNAIVPGLLAMSVGFGIARRRGSLHVGDEPERDGSLSARAAALPSLLAVAVFGTATVLLVLEVRSLDGTFIAFCDTLRNLPAYGFVFGIVFFVAHAVERDARTAAHRRNGHALNALFVAALVCSMIYHTSFIYFYPFYYNEPSIPIAVLCFYVATERCGLGWATPLALALSVLPTFGVKLNRALSDDTPVTSGHWAGMRVNYRGMEVLRAAARAQQLAGASGTVLVLPEDVELAGLVHRPRPPLVGAVIFVDQYPKRLLSEDLRALDEHLPAVVVIHPRNSSDWKSMFHTWSDDSAAEQMVDHVLTSVLPKEYTLDSSYSSIFFWDAGHIDVYARRTKAEE